MWLKQGSSGIAGRGLAADYCEANFLALVEICGIRLGVDSISSAGDGCAKHVAMNLAAVMTISTMGD